MHKEYIPGDSHGSEQRESPNGYANSYTDKFGEAFDNGSNFDEKIEADEPETTSFESIAEDRELADYIKDQIIYSGIFIDQKELHDKFPPTLYHAIRDPHVTVSYRPDAKGVFLDALNDEARIRVIGYGNNGENEGLLAEVIADNPAIQKNLQDNIGISDDIETKPIPVHITLSIDEHTSAYNTRKLNFRPLKTPVELTGNYKLFCKDGTLISDKKVVREMKQNGFNANREVDPDRI